MCDAILVLGGGVRERGELPPWVVRRFDRALDVSDTAPIVCLSAATVHRLLPLNAEGYPILESVAGAAHLLARGVPPQRIQVEATSYDTIGNAELRKTIACRSRGLEEPDHRYIGVPHAPFESDLRMDLRHLTGKYRLRFEAAPDDGLSALLLQRRRDKEAAALRSLANVMNNAYPICRHCTGGFTPSTTRTLPKAGRIGELLRPNWSKSTNGDPARAPSTGRRPRASTAPPSES